jgi:hypothetical protein
MAKLIDDPQVQALIEKEKAKALAALKKLHLSAIKERVAAEIEAFKSAGNSAAAKGLRTVLADITAKLKEI